MSRRDEILTAAVGLAERGGLSALSVRGVAQAAGIGASTLRHYFPTQARLHEAVAQRVMDHALSDGDIADASRPAADRLCDRLEQFLPLDSSPEVFLDAWFRGQVTALGPQATEAARRLLAHGHRVSAAALRGWLDTLSAEGAVDPADRDVHVDVLLALIEGLALHLLADPGRVDVAAARRSLRWAVDRIVTGTP